MPLTKNSNLVDKLKSRTIAVGTVIGIDVREYNRAKLKLIGNRFQEQQVFNM